MAGRDPAQREMPTDVRKPAVAGMFYPADAQQCVHMAREYVAAKDLIGAADSAGQHRPLVGAIVPHAGWICSGAIAGQAIAALKRRSDADLVVVFGAVHTPIPLDSAVLCSKHRWLVPGSESQVPQDVNDLLSRATGLFGVDDRFHEREHAVEVELPLIAAAWPGIKILPIEVPLIDAAEEIGRRTARAVMEADRKAVYLASSDLTHYGPAYQFAPAGVGMQGLEWAKENDRRLLETIEKFEVDNVVPHVRQNLNACGGGAIAAMLSACRELGAKHATVLRHATSYETLRDVAPQSPHNAVGYAAVVVE